MICDLSLFEPGSVQNYGSSRAALSKVLKDLFDRRQFPLRAGVRLDCLIRYANPTRFIRQLAPRKANGAKASFGGGHRAVHFLRPWVCVLSVGIQGRAGIAQPSRQGWLHAVLG